MRSAPVSSTIRAIRDVTTRCRASSPSGSTGETLANQGMMLSPWYPPRYVWAAIEGACGLDVRGEAIACNPRLAPQWKWIGARNVPVRGKALTWFAVRLPETTLYTNFGCVTGLRLQPYDRDVTPMLQLGDDVTEIALQRGKDFVIFMGNTASRTITTPLAVRTVR